MSELLMNIFARVAAVEKTRVEGDWKTVFSLALAFRFESSLLPTESFTLVQTYASSKFYIRLFFLALPQQAEIK